MKQVLQKWGSLQSAYTLHSEGCRSPRRWQFSRRNSVCFWSSEPRPDKPRVITVRLKGYVTVEKSIIPDGKDIPIGLTLVPDPVK